VPDAAVLVAGVVAAVGIGVATRLPRLRVAAVAAWIGLMAPLVYQQSTSTTQIQTGGTSPAAQAEAAVMLLAIVFAFLALGLSLRPRGVERYLLLYLSVAVASTAGSSYPTATLVKVGQPI